MANLLATTIATTGLLKMPQGSTAARPTGVAGMVRYNTDLRYTEYYTGSTWIEFVDNTPLNQYNRATGGIVGHYGPYVNHTFLYELMVADVAEVNITSSDANFKVMKRFRCTRTGSMDVRFEAYIVSGTYYWAYRIRRNNATNIATGGYSSGPFYQDDTTSVHAYRKFIVTGLSVVDGDEITIEMCSASGAEAIATGNGQGLVMRHMYAFHYTHAFVPQMTGTVEVLLVAGGGSGGTHNGGGGGAGGLIYNSAFPVTAGTSYAVAIGRGGAGRLLFDVPGRNGGNSAFGSLTAIGGGAGGNNGTAAAAGGSGGGPGGAGGAGGAPTAGQGYAGGVNDSYAGGGGGGAGGVGGTADANKNAGSGGPGLPFDISGATMWYAGGGGGSTIAANMGGYSTALYSTNGVGGAGGGSDGHQNIAGPATPNTGGGGGAADRSPGFSGDGACGIAIVRYLNPNPVPVSQIFTHIGDQTWVCPTGVTKVEALIVAGGGSGGEGHGGGGGAGGLVYISALNVTPGTTYTITVGAGGARKNSGSNSNGNAGSNSVAFGYTATGGGFGGGYSAAGGSGGSAGGSGGATSSFTAGTVAQGNQGGHSASITNSGGGGGGGAGSGGQTIAPGAYAGNSITAGVGNGVGTWGGKGGDGLPYAISGVLTYYAGGGGGGGESQFQAGPGGLGGGGRGAGVLFYPQAGSPNTGGGGGGGSAGGGARTRWGAAGGSGIVIIKWYPPQ